ncbi:hypothetical protein Acr_27g0003390 [Actinidia rufa]|uniref:Retrotransposon gag domain-containing protein n=1 Tax=Actinidia rufa TaxID=165716 RepID=A0A7J0H678_9ERIC|nr:hypothetical protein Acr_27g0003390 [Actinidia rufa]
MIIVQAEDAQIHILLWNSMEPKISGCLVFLNSAKRVWDGAKDKYSRLDNLRRTYELHQTFISLTLEDMSLEDYYARFRSVCDELDLAKPFLIDISVMQKQRESMCIACFLSGLPYSFDYVSAKLLGSKELPSLSKVFSRLHQASLFSAPLVSTIGDRSALVSSVGGSRSLTCSTPMLARRSTTLFPSLKVWPMGHFMPCQQLLAVCI